VSPPPRGAAGEDAADRIGAEPALLDGAPAVDLAEYRSELLCWRPPASRAAPPPGNSPASRRKEPPAQAAVSGAGARIGEFNGGCSEPELLGIEADQGSAAEARGGEQQQGAGGRGRVPF
jgi:hypothetical protein